MSIVGTKSASRVKILEKLIGTLSKKGYRVGVLKRLAKDDAEIDEAGKDSYRYRAGGAERVALAGGKRLAIFSNLAHEMPLSTLLGLFGGFVLVFLEGFCLEEGPKIDLSPDGAEPSWIASEIEEKFLARNVR